MKKYLVILFLLIACPVWGATKTVCAEGCDYTTIAQAEAGATAGDTVNVSAGTYNENNPTFTKALTWVAIDGNGTVTITNSGTGPYAAQFTGNSEIHITGFVFDALSTKASSLLYASGSSNKYLNYCTISNATNLMTFSGSNSNNYFSYSTFTGSPEYVLFGGVETLFMNNNTFNVTVGTTFCYMVGGTISFTDNTVTIVFSTASALWDFNGAGISLTSTGNSISLSGATQRIINGTRAAGTGSVTMSDTITSSATYSSNPFYFTNPGWTIDIDNSVITITNSNYTGTLFSFTDQINPIIRNSN